MKRWTRLGAFLGVLALAAGAMAADKYTPAQLKAAAKACSSVNGLCPVMGNLVTPKGGSATYKGEKVSFCCKGCAAKFNADPTRYMDLMRMNPPKYWYASKLPAVSAMRKAKAAVKSANGRCPVMGKLVTPTGGTSVYKGQKIQFCCPGCKGRFEKAPEKYMRIMRADPLAYEYDRSGPTGAQLRKARKAVKAVNGLCPVTRKLVTVAGGSVVYRGEKIAFFSADAMKKFQAKPEAYASAMREEPAVFGYIPTGK